MFCNITGVCENCENIDTDVENCPSNGYKQKLTCLNSSIIGNNFDADSYIIVYRNCIETRLTSSSSFYLFESVVVGLLVCAVYIMRQRKKTLERIQYEKIMKQVGSSYSKDRSALFSSVVLDKVHPPSTAIPLSNSTPISPCPSRISLLSSANSLDNDMRK